jgi:sugar lactone lactonase YvrE
MVASDGTLYATEMTSGDTSEGGLPPGSGRLVRQTGADQSADVAINLDYPVALRLGPDGMAYIALPAYGQNDQAGMIVRVDLTAPQPMALDVKQAAVRRCPAAEGYVPAGPGVASPVPFPVSTPAAG